MTRFKIGSALLLIALALDAAVAQTLYGLTRTENQTVKLVEIDPSTGAVTTTLNIYNLGTAAVFANLTFHPPSGDFLALSGGANVTPQLLILDPGDGTSSVVPITGLPAAHPDVAGLEYWDAEGRIMMTAGSNFSENQITEINLTGAVINSVVPLGLVDSDFLGESESGELLSIDYNEDLRDAIATVADPFGAIQVAGTGTDPPTDNNIVGTAVAPSTGELLAVDLATDNLIRVDPTAYVAIGAFGIPEIVIGLEFATLSVPGDTDGDGDVDLVDLDTLGANFGAGPNAPGGASIGDFDGDGDVDLVDLDTLGANFGAGTSTVVAEPAAIAPLLFAAAAVLRRRR